MNSHTEITSATPGDAWIMCDSKSHPGLKFYVNKVTGIKVWNITDTEIAFAEKAGKEDSTEPLGRPTMKPTNEANILYNKQIINNQFSNQMPNLMLKSVRVCNPYNIWDNPQNQPPQMQTQQLFTIVPAAIASVNNQIAPNIQGYQQLLPLPSNLQNTNLPYYVQNHQTPETPRAAKRKKQHWYRRKSFNDGSQENFSNTNNSDLRRKLVRRNYCGSVENKKKDLTENELSTRNDKRNCFGQGLADPSIQINLAPLKTITSKGGPDSDQWYIVVDKDVILENYNYLNNMAAADPDCHLLIPHHVMSDLREYASTSSNVQARRIVRFLTQQIESGLAMLGEEVFAQGIYHKTILTCVKLASRDSHVILISNNEEIFNYKPNIEDIHVFTMQDIKDILENRLTRPRRVKSPTLDIRIVIPNNSFGHEDENTTQKTIGSTELSDYTVLTKSSMGVNSVNNSKTEDQNSLKSVANSAKQLPETRTPTRIEFREHSVDNSKTDDQNPPKSVANCAKQFPETGANTRFDFREHSVDNSKTDDQSPPKSIANCAKRFPETGANTKFEFREHSVDNSKTDDQNPAKSVENCAQQFPETGAHTRIVFREHSVENSKTDEQNPAKCVNCAKQFLETGAHTRVEFREHFVDSKTDDQIPKESEVFSESDVLTKNTLGIHSIDNNSKSENQNPPEIADNSSSSVASNISLDTLRMKEIISRKRLMSKETTLKFKKKLSIINTSKNKEATLETTPQKVHRTKSASTSASCDNDNTSEASVKRHVHCENVIVEETSTSSISNSESSHSEKVVSPLNNGFGKVGLRTVVMFGVAGQSMVDILKTRSDEWVFRFVQIMEEVLRVKLHEKPLENKEPAPWNLLEATRCIIKKFSNHFSVVDAANKLSFVLYKTSDEHGKISVKIEPSDYMEMYSYGLFLVETFQDMSANCKEKDCKKKKNIRSTKYEADSCSCYEVETASESLKKLLYDIQNANLETFVDNPEDLAMHYANDGSNHYDSETVTREETRKQDETLCDNIVFSYPTRSQKRKSQIKENEKLLSKITINKATKSNFLNSLQLKKKVDTSKQDVHKNDKDLKYDDIQNALKNKVPCPIKTVVRSPAKPPKEPEYLADLKCHFSKDDSIDIPKSPSKVICNFTVNPVFERKVKAKQNQKIYEVYAENEEADGYSRTVDNTLTANRTVDNMPSANETDEHMLTGTKTDEYMLTETKTDEYMLTGNKTDACMLTRNKTTDYIPTANEKYMRTANDKDEYMPTAKKIVPFMPTANKKHMPTAKKTVPFMPTANETVNFMPTTNEKNIRIANETDDYMQTAHESLVPKANQSEHGENNNDACEESEKFMRFIGKIARRLADVFDQVKLLCGKYIKEVTNDHSDVSTRELHDKVEMACSFIGNVHKLLDSISKRELQDRNEKIQKLLKIANIEDFIPDDKLCLDYRHVLTICTDQAKKTHENLRGILKLVRR